MIKYFLVSALLVVSLFGSGYTFAQDKVTKYSIVESGVGDSKRIIKIQFSALTEGDKDVVFKKIQSLSSVRAIYWVESKELVVESDDSRVLKIINGIFMEYGYKLIVQ